MHTHTHAHTHAHTHIHTHTYTHTTYTLIHTATHTYTHTLSHSHGPLQTIQADPILAPFLEVGRVKTKTKKMQRREDDGVITDIQIVNVKRADVRTLDPMLQAELKRLKSAPVLPQSQSAPLSEILSAVSSSDERMFRGGEGEGEGRKEGEGGGRRIYSEEG